MQRRLSNARVIDQCSAVSAISLDIFVLVEAGIANLVDRIE